MNHLWLIENMRVQKSVYLKSYHRQMASSLGIDMGKEYTQQKF